MTPTQIEAWTIRIADIATAGKRVEDQRVELKAAFPDPPEAARRIAAHANAANGEPVLWIVGIDEERGAVGAPAIEIADWVAAVKVQFDAIPPAFTQLQVPYHEVQLAALFIDSSRAPYVVVNPDYGKKPTPISREVPWREGTQTRSATREDLVRLLDRVTPLPEAEWLHAKVVFSRPTEAPLLLYRLVATLYMVPRDERPLVLPFHKCCGLLRFIELAVTSPLQKITLEPRTLYGGSKARVLSHTVAASDTEAILTGPGAVVVRAEGRLEGELPSELESITLEFQCVPVLSTGTLVASIALPIFPVGSTSSDTYEYSPAAPESTA